jgi:hypothetical protein
MWKKIRRFYWYQRDRGRGKQTMVTAVVCFLVMIFFVGLIAKNIVRRESVGDKKVTSQTIVSGTAVTVVSVSGTAVDDVLEDEIPEEEETENQQEQVEEISVDTSGLSTFLGFMTDAAYQDLENQLVSICQNRGCKSVKKLTYQQTKDNSYDVTSFVLLSDGSVYSCDYNLKSCAWSVSETSYTEVTINQMKEKQLQAERKELKKQQQAKKKKLEKQSSQKKSKKKTGSKKRAVKKATSKKKSAKRKKK